MSQDNQPGEQSPSAGDTPRLSEIPDHIKDYVQAKADYYKLTAIEAIGKAAGNAVSGVTLLFLGLFCVIFLSIGLGIFLGEVLDSMHQGFLILGGIYLLLIVIVLFIRQRVIHTPVFNAVISKLANPSVHESENS